MCSFRAREVPGNDSGLIKPSQASPKRVPWSFKGEGEIRGEEISRITQARFGQLGSGAASPLAGLRSSSVSLIQSWRGSECLTVVISVMHGRKFLNEQREKIIFIITVLKDAHKILMNLLDSSWKT